MATSFAEIEDDNEDDAPLLRDTLTLEEILTDGVNLADALSPQTVNRIGQAVIREREIDWQSLVKSGWIDRYERALDLAMQVTKPKTMPWPGASNVKYPLLSTASIQFQARAYPAIVDGSNLVKGRVLGPDPDGTKRARADRIGEHMTWQLLYRMAGWEEDTDRLLLTLPIVGCVFRKSFYDAVENANRSETVPAIDLVVNYWAKSLKTAPRFTHTLRYYPYEVKEKVAAGLWRDIPVEADDAEATEDSEALVEFYEQHRREDLDGDGFPEPYVVTVNRNGDVARIVPCFGPEDVKIMGGRIVQIVQRQYFVKYGFLPAPDSSFYDMGFGSLLEGITASIDTAINQMFDAATLQNAGGGFIGDGVNIRGGNFKFRIGEWKRVSFPGQKLADNLMPMPAPGPSAVLFNLLGLLIEAAKEITAVQDVMTGEGQANQPATTTLALIEQGQKVMTGIFKRIHRAFGEELRILRGLNRVYLDEEEYYQLNDGDAQPISREDYEDGDLDVIPVSDPNMVSDMQKMARAQALMIWNGDPLVNQELIRRRYFEAVGERDVAALLEVPPPQPDPNVLLESMKEVRAKEESGAKVRASDAKATVDLAGAAEKFVNLGLLPDAAAIAGAAAELGGDVDDEAEPVAEQGRVPPMEGEPADAGVPGLPEGPAIGLDDGMGADGPIDDAGATGAGGTLGPVGGDQF
jgi:chaperonin GroES